MHIWIMGFLFCFPYSHFPRIVSSSLWRNQERYLWSKWEDTHRVDGAGMNIGPHFSLSLCFPSVTVISNYVTKTDYIRVIINKISEVHCEDCFLGAILNSELCHFWNALSHSRKLACVWEEIDLVQWCSYSALFVYFIVVNDPVISDHLEFDQANAGFREAECPEWDEGRIRRHGRVGAVWSCGETKYTQKIEQPG